MYCFCLGGFSGPLFLQQCLLPLLAEVLQSPFMLLLFCCHLGMQGLLQLLLKLILVRQLLVGSFQPHAPRVFQRGAAFFRGRGVLLHAGGNVCLMQLPSAL